VNSHTIGSVGMTDVTDLRQMTCTL